VTITSPPGSGNQATVAVTLTVVPGPPPLPQLGTAPLVASIVNAASQATGTVSPGQIVTIFGQNFGPSTPVGFGLGANGKVETSLGGAQVLFDGLAAPVIYANATQINAIVPYEVAGARSTNVQVQFSGSTIPAGAIPVASAAPGIFTLESSGQGAAAVLNLDNSINTAANPAARGSTVQIFRHRRGAYLAGRSYRRSYGLGCQTAGVAGQCDDRRSGSYGGLCCFSAERGSWPLPGECGSSGKLIGCTGGTGGAYGG
jgi:hypothetical protein